MPVYSRKYLRQTLGRVHLRDTVVGTTTATGPAVVDQRLADTTLSGQGQYVGTWVRHNGMDLRVASFNVGSGAHVTGMILGTLVASGAEYERHGVLPPADKDRALDEAIKRLRVRREVAVDAVDGARFYPMLDVEQVLDAYYFATPDGSLDRDRRSLRSVETVVTATGGEVRIAPALAGGQRLVLDAILGATLGAADAATVNVPDERLILYGAEAACWDLVARAAPRGTVDEYRRLRDEAARQYDALARNFAIPVDRPIRLGEDG